VLLFSAKCDISALYLKEITDIGDEKKMKKNKTKLLPQTVCRYTSGADARKSHIFLGLSFFTCKILLEG
jgi:hypothetical protein